MIFASNGWMICKWKAIDPNMQDGCKRHVDYFLHVISHLYILILLINLKNNFSMFLLLTQLFNFIMVLDCFLEACL